MRKRKEVFQYMSPRFFSLFFLNVKVTIHFIKKDACFTSHDRLTNGILMVSVQRICHLIGTCNGMVNAIGSHTQQSEQYTLKLTHVHAHMHYYIHTYIHKYAHEIPTDTYVYLSRYQGEGRMVFFVSTSKRCYPNIRGIATYYVICFIFSLLLVSRVSPDF